MVSYQFTTYLNFYLFSIRYWFASSVMRYAHVLKFSFDKFSMSSDHVFTCRVIMFVVFCELIGIQSLEGCNYAYVVLLAWI